MQSADVQTDLEQNTESQTAGDIPAHTSLEQSEPDWDPYELFSASEDSAASNTDTAADSPMLSEGIENTEAFEQSFLSGLQSDEESGIMQVESHEETVEPAQTAKAAEQAQKPLTAQERLALLGAALLEKGGMPSPEQLSAMGTSAPAARGIQSLVWLATEGDPTARRAVEAMIDLTAPEAQEEQHREADTVRVSAVMQLHANSESDLPRIASYEDFGSNHKSDNSVKNVGTVDFSDSGEVVRRLEQEEFRAVSLDYEVNCTVTSDGEVWMVSGDAVSVDPTQIPRELKGSWSYHNHPASKTWYSFSAEDAAFFVESGQAYSKASDDIFEYVMQRRDDTIHANYEVVYNRFREIRRTKVMEMMWDGIIDREFDEYHETMNILSQEFRFDYMRRRRNGSK